LGWGGLASAVFTLRASQYCWAGRVGGFVAAQSQQPTTAHRPMPCRRSNLDWLMIQAILLITDYIKNGAIREYINTRVRLLKFWDLIIIFF
jgi:hypothetical protein